MRDRVFRQLLEAASNTPPANPFDELTRPIALQVLTRSQQLGWNLLEAPHRLNLRTIDSVCAGIARGLPVLSGSGGGLTPVDDAAPLHREAAERTLLLLGNPTDPTLHAALELLLLHRDGSLPDATNLLAEMLAHRDQWGSLVPLTAPTLTDEYLDQTVLPRLDRALELAVCRALTRLTRILPTRFLSSLTTIAEDMAHIEGYRGAPNPLALCRGRNQPPGERAEDLEHWRALLHLVITPSGGGWRKRFATSDLKLELVPKHHVAELKQIVDAVRDEDTLREALCSLSDLPPAQYPRDQWPLAKALFRVLARALVELQLVFAAHGECDFTESALLAKAALRRPSALDDLRASTVLDLQHLLVDEMQDTSTAQYELLELLTSHWDGHSQTLFLVGDPKQSIYLFREARVERFVQTMLHHTLSNSTDTLHIEPLHLTANFRSQRTLVADFNTTFFPLFPPTPDPQHPETVPFTPAQPRRPATSTAAQFWHTVLFPYTPDPAQKSGLERTQAQADAQEIRRLVLHHQRTPLASGKLPTLAVLVRNRVHLLEIIAAFKAAPAIPYRAVDIEPLTERQEILDLLTLTRALLHPADRTAWLALLRTPWVGLTLPDLHTLTGAEDDPPAGRHTPILHLLATRGDLLSADGIARLQPFWSVITAALDQQTSMSLTRLVERTWQAFNAPAHASDEELANTTRFFALLAELETTEGTLDLPTLTARLARLYATPPPIPGAVDLSTMHKAKGLEWDVVFLPALNRLAGRDRTRLLAWLETDPEANPSAHPGSDSGGEPAAGNSEIAPGILAPIQAKGAESHVLATWMRSVQSTRAAAERTRLFYVACTRAREELHLFASTSRDSKGEPCPRKASLLHAAWPAAAPHFADRAPNLIELPLPPTATPIPLGLAIAAAAEPRLIQRIAQLPPSVLGAPGSTASPSTLGSQISTQPRPYSRPEGSFAARSFGNTMHAFLEQLATRTAQGQTPTQLLTELPTWPPRITAILRTAGLPPAQVSRFTTDILRGLTNTLQSPEGQWLLGPHPTAQTESTLTSTQDEITKSIRLDRTFLAGPTPLSNGTTHLWVIDYKTASHAATNLEPFLEAELKKYRPQLETYAQTLTHQPLPIRLALFYPMLPKLLTW